ncbi:hypothetical protein [Burkholderia sp. BDU5]|uniref:hypothetical protein n=1 Tax=Burkholderia sp. BDU5 TaxID=1385590 RepID=UPI0018D20EC3|nr:hypothetical protein [Burkholderia sp. BDU5]
MPKGVVELSLGDDAFRREIGLVERNAGGGDAGRGGGVCELRRARKGGIRSNGAVGDGRRLKSANRKRF